MVLELGYPRTGACEGSDLHRNWINRLGPRGKRTKSRVIDGRNGELYNSDWLTPQHESKQQRRTPQPRSSPDFVFAFLGSERRSHGDSQMESLFNPVWTLAPV